jgi:diacylglycerol kinase family enzyme
MRAAAILGPRSVAKSLATFQRLTNAEWTSLIEQADVAVIFGGDGTVHRHLAKLVEVEIPVLVVPCGSGNDFARALNIRNVRDAARAWNNFAAGGKARAIDLGVISQLPSPDELMPGQLTGPAEAAPSPLDSPLASLSSARDARFQHGPDTRTHTSTAVEVSPIPIPVLAPAKASVPQPHYFCCVAGVGVDTAIARRANALPKWIRSRGGYALSAPGEFMRFAPFPVKISLNGTDTSTFQPTTLVSVANAPAYGGGMKIAPHAKLDDGKLDLCVVRGMNPFKLFCLFPTVYVGRHLGFREVEYEQTDCVRVETEVPLDVYADGDYVCQTPVEFSVAHRALKVISPE